MVYTKVIKPIADRVGAIVLIVVLSPLLLVIILILTLFQGGAIFYLQDRPGLRGKKFKLIKFTSMQGLADQKIVTPLGRFLRKTSLDELPQLINVLKGEMSMVGPRPFLMEYVELYSGDQFKRHEVLPGITGWAQVNGRTSISWQQKFEYDRYYVDHISFKLDMKILCKTVILFFSSNSETSLHEPKFTGK